VFVLSVSMFFNVSEYDSKIYLFNEIHSKDDMTKATVIHVR